MPEMLGTYEIGNLIGGGSFASVHRAIDTATGRACALKILHPGLLQDQLFVDRFLQEGRILQSLDHPNIVHVYEVAQIGGRLVLALELVTRASPVTGEDNQAQMSADLATEIRQRGPIPWQEALRLLRGICDGLDYAHARGVLHRDIKPSNILLGQERIPQLTDFGFARLIDENATSFTLSRTTAGTPAYVAPEIWEDHAYSVASDLYALACVAYELLTGTQLFRGSTPLQTMRQHDKGPELPAKWPESLPAGIGDVLRRALAREPSERYISASEFYRALLRLQGPMLPTPAKSDPIKARSRDNRVLLGLGGGSIALVLAVVVGFVITQTGSSPRIASGNTATIAAVTPTLVVPVATQPRLAPRATASKPTATAVSTVATPSAVASATSSLQPVETQTATDAIAATQIAQTALVAEQSVRMTADTQSTTQAANIAQQATRSAEAIRETAVAQQAAQATTLARNTQATADAKAASQSMSQTQAVQATADAQQAAQATGTAQAQLEQQAAAGIQFTGARLADKSKPDSATIEVTYQYTGPVIPGLSISLTCPANKVRPGSICIIVGTGDISHTGKDGVLRGIEYHMTPGDHFTTDTITVELDYTFKPGYYRILASKMFNIKIDWTSP